MPTVLVVDDEPTILELVRCTLEDDRIAVIEASDGVEALERARATRPDLIFLDVQMPRLDGFEVCRRLREDPTLAGVRVVMDHAKEIRDSASDYKRIFTLVKGKLARDRGFVL